MLLKIAWLGLIDNSMIAIIHNEEDVPEIWQEDS